MFLKLVEEFPISVSLAMHTYTSRSRFVGQVAEILRHLNSPIMEKPPNLETRLQLDDGEDQ